MAVLAWVVGVVPWSSGCAEVVDDEQDEFRTTMTPDLETDDGWHPHTVTPQQCNDPEGEYTRPPENGYCDIEMRLTATTFDTGQGASEGRGELSFDVTATPVPGPGGPTVVGGPQDVYTPGESKGTEGDLGTYRVWVGTTRDIQVCATMTEHDNGGANGVDDVGSSCEIITLACNAGTGAPSDEEVIGPEPLCGDNTCRGSASVTIGVMRADADDDGVENDDDFTPEPCDELDKGLAGRAVLVYFHYGDNPLTTFAQASFTNLAQVYSGYDYVVFVADNEASNANNMLGEAFHHADRVYPPTRPGLLDAMQHLTAEGWNFDFFGHAHGYTVNDPEDSKFEVVSGHSITGNWLESATHPDVAGTERGGVPMLAYWSTTCISARLIDSFITIGAKVANGTVDIQFFPNTWGPFVDKWLAGVPYGQAVADSLTLDVIAEAELVVAGQGLAPPYYCIEDTVVGENECAHDFFSDDFGPNEAFYPIQEYDAELSGAENMYLSSIRLFEGNQNVTIAATGQLWP